MADQRLDEIVRPHTTVADRIRALDAAGVPRADIARFLGKRYQHVRNVLEGDAQSSGGGYVLGRADLSGLQEGPRAFDQQDDDAFVQPRGNSAWRLIVRPDGSLVLPPEVSRLLNADPGKAVMARIEGRTFQVVSVETALEEAIAIVAKYVPKDQSLVDSFLANRRRTWGEENEDDG